MSSKRASRGDRPGPDDNELAAPDAGGTPEVTEVTDGVAATNVDAQVEAPKAAAIRSALGPFLGAPAGKGKGGPSDFGEDLLDVGHVEWRAYDAHTEWQQDFAKLADAQQAAIDHLHYKHPGAIKHAGNLTFITITPIIKVTVKDAQDGPAPVPQPKHDNFVKAVG